MARSRRGKRKYGPVARVFQGTLTVLFVLLGVVFVFAGLRVIFDSRVLPGVIVVGFGLMFLLWATRLAFRAATGKRNPSRVTGPSAVFFGGGGDGGDFGGDGGGGDGC